MKSRWAAYDGAPKFTRSATCVACAAAKRRVLVSSPFSPEFAEFQPFPRSDQDCFVARSARLVLRLTLHDTSLFSQVVADLAASAVPT